ncbi:hypothetical protein L2E82_39127 [Cichorium intybus]|uniref:Uncharacterized protein n=1 Tax=Cichorium intybus TaxID=13427 RepID=A0ACB9AGU6_CICIN|nr:hypothetical protein L2E82_39127 [Cichorium intybus]
MNKSYLDVFPTIAQSSQWFVLDVVSMSDKLTYFYFDGRSEELSSMRRCEDLSSSFSYSAFGSYLKRDHAHRSPISNFDVSKSGFIE